MGWKKALFFGGAVLLLAACDRATAPNALAVEAGNAALTVKRPVVAPPTTKKGTRLGTNNLGDDLCAYNVRTGADSTESCSLSIDR